MSTSADFSPGDIRSMLSDDPSETVVFAVDVIAQPHYRNRFVEYDPLVHTKCSRALPCAKEDDVVVLSGPADDRYYRWLRSFGMGPARVVSYNAAGPGSSLSELIAADPGPVEEAVAATGKKPVFVPFYSGAAEAKAAGVLGAELFGCDESIILKYFNKERFKAECAALGIPTVGGKNARPAAGGGDPLSRDELAEVVESLLGHYPRLILRGAEGSAGSSLFTVTGDNLEEVCREIRARHEKSVLVEPFLKVVASPNDQWVVDRKGRTFRLGLTTQLFEGLKHVGNLKGQYLSERIETFVTGASRLIVDEMNAHGYRGVVGIDYIVSEEGIFPVENNARMNGSSFTFGVVSAVERSTGPVGSWKFFRACTAPCDFDALLERLSPVLYDGRKKNCVFPYDCDTLRVNGQFTPVLLAEDMYHVDYLEQVLAELGVTKR